MYRRFQRFFEYDIRSNERVIDALRRVPQEALSGERGDAWQRAVDIFSHMQAARQLWLHRMGGPIEAPADLFPKGTTLEESVDWFERVNEAWRPFMDGLSDAHLRRVFDYPSIEGGRYRSRVEDILIQLFGHGWYHRGQIAMLTRFSGGEPAVTDWVYETRERLG